MWVSYTVFLSCLSSLEENSLRMSRNARLRGGLPSPCGLGSLKANSIPSLNTENTHPVTLTKTYWHIVYINAGARIQFLLVEHCNGLPGFDLIESKREWEASGQFFNPTECRCGSIEVTAQIIQHLIKQLKHKHHTCVIQFGWECWSE